MSSHCNTIQISQIVKRFAFESVALAKLGGNITMCLDIYSLGVILAVAYNHCQCIAQQGAIIEQCVVATTPSLPVPANCQAICLCWLIASALGGLEAIIAQTAQVKNSSNRKCDSNCCEGLQCKEWRVQPLAVTVAVRLCKFANKMQQPGCIWFANLPEQLLNAIARGRLPSP